MNKVSENWPIVKFGDVVKLNTERSANPVADGIERYVGLEHIEPEDLRIRRWGLVEEGTTFTNRFRPGQVLFGKRRAYQRKVAVADFEGVCSGDIYVFEPKNNRLLPELLPFLCQTEAFFEYAVGTSAGSLSPRTNWTQLANFEFALPPLEEQQRIANVFRSFYNNHIVLFEALVSANRLFQSSMVQMMSKGALNEESTTTGYLTHPQSWRVVPLDSVATVERGKFSHRPRNLPQFYGGEYPFVQTGDIAASNGELDQISQYLSEEGRQYSRSFPADTILITIAAVIGATAITTTDTWCPDSIVGIQVKESMDVRFLEYFLRYIKPYLEFQVATQTAQKNINLEILRPLLVPYPALTEQIKIVKILQDVEGSVRSLETRLTQCKLAMANFRERLFSKGINHVH